MTNAAQQFEFLSGTLYGVKAHTEDEAQRLIDGYFDDSLTLDELALVSELDVSTELVFDPTIEFDAKRKGICYLLGISITPEEWAKFIPWARLGFEDTIGKFGNENGPLIGYWWLDQWAEYVSARDHLNS